MVNYIELWKRKHQGLTSHQVILGVAKQLGCRDPAVLEKYLNKKSKQTCDSLEMINNVADGLNPNNVPADSQQAEAEARANAIRSSKIKTKTETAAEEKKNGENI